MSAEDLWEQAQEILERVEHLSGEARATTIQRLVGDDTELAALIEKLEVGRRLRDEDRIEASTDAPGFLSTGLLTEDAPTRGTEGAAPEAIAGFHILHEIGRGGRGVVYLGQRPDGSLAAVKVLHNAAVAEDHHLLRFRREMQVVKRLDHPHIVKLLELGPEHDPPYLAMEYVHGRNLAEDIDRARTAAGHPARPSYLLDSGLTKLPQRAASIALHLAEALAHAHANGVIHRDVKPHNVILDERRQPKLVDFGLAYANDAAAITITGDLEGTPHYMSPEQVAALKHPALDARTDVYSLGVVLFEMLTRQRPFQGATHRQVMDAISTRIPPRVRSLDPSVPVDLETICHRAMAKRPEDRYQSAQALADDLRRFLNLQAIVARPQSLPMRLLRTAQRNRDPILATALLVGGVISGLTLRERWAANATVQALEEELSARLSAVASGSDPMSLVDKALCERFEALEPATRTALQASMARLTAHMDDVVAERLAAARKLLEAGPAPRTTLDEPVFASDPIQQVLQILTELARYADVDPVEEFGDLLLVRVRLEFDTPDPDLPCRVTAHLLDPVTETEGPELTLVEAADPREPLDLVLAAGRYILRVRQADDRLAEVVRDYGQRGQSREATVTLRSVTEVSEGMVRIEGGPTTRYTFVNRPSDQGTLEQRVPVTLKPYLIDESPVTNGEYAAFLDATGHPPPSMWEGLDRSGDWAAKPVAWVTRDDARTYAEWAGKRLPTALEWLYAVTGSDEHAYPWGNDSERLTPAALESLGFGAPMHPIGPDFSIENVHAWYGAHVRPVGGTPDDLRGPHALDGGLGGLREWTESSQVILRGASLDVDGAARVLGLPCFSTPDRLSANGLDHLIAFRPGAQLTDVGFRCVRSLPAD